MSFSKPMSRATEMKLKETLRQRQCESIGCNGKVKFQFDGNYACNHHICGHCLSLMYISGENPILYCPKCAQQEQRRVSSVSYQCLIKTFLEANICTTCFNYEAIHRETCGHLLCEQCVIAFSRCNLVKCSVKKCSESHKGDVLAEVLLWRKFKLLGFTRCEGKSCKQMAVLAIKECGHSYCPGCLKKLLLKERDNVTRQCDVFLCFKTIPLSPIKRFLSKLEDVSFMTTVIVELSSIQCYRCGNSDGRNVYKAKLRNRQCPYRHSFCIDCMLSFIPKHSVKDRCVQTDRTDDNVICQSKGCKMKTPLCCLREMVDLIQQTKQSTDVFMRESYIYEKCSKCRRAQGMVTRIACEHALCKDCLRRLVNEETRWYNECEGAFGTCKYRVPLWVLKCFKDKMKSRQLLKPAETFDYSTQVTAVFDVPDIVLESKLDEEGCLLYLKATIISCVPVENRIWMKNRSIVTETSDKKYRIINEDSVCSTLIISSLSKSDEGIYNFFAENCNGEGKSNALTFKIPHDPPVVRMLSEHLDGSAIITAEIYSKWPLIETKWLKDGRKVYIVEEEGVLETKDNCQFSQKIRLNTYKSQVQGYYKFIAASLAGKSESEEIFVNTFEKPPIVSLSKTVTKSREKVMFVGDIIATSLFKPVVWMKNGNELDVSNEKKFSFRHILDYNPKLEIFHVDETDEGEYQLMAQNTGGKNISEPVPFRFEKDNDRPKIQIREPYIGPISIFLTAEIQSDWPIKNMDWMKDNELIQTSCPYMDVGKGMSCITLRIFNTKETGNFQAIAENAAGISKSERIQLLRKDFLEGNLELRVYPFLDRVELKGKIESSQNLEKVVWLKNNQILAIDHLDKYASFQDEKGNLKLIITKISTEDEGTYSFIAKTQNTEVQSNSENFRIKEDPPKIVIHSSMKDKGSIILDAVIVKTSWPVKSIKWEKQGTVVQIVQKYVNANEITTSRLRLNDVKEGGLYKVIAESAAGKGEAERYLPQEEIQISMPPSLGICVDKLHQSVSLLATFESAKEVGKAVWIKNGKKINIAHDRYQQSVISDKKCVLVISPVNKRDEGNYKVISLTDLGSEESNAVPFEIGEEPPKVVSFNKKEEILPVTLHACFKSEWPVRKIHWYRNDEKLKPSEEYYMYNDDQTCTLEIQSLEKSGMYRLELESIGGTERNACTEIVHCGIAKSQTEMISAETSVCSPNDKGKENVLKPVMLSYIGSGDCDICDYTAVAKVEGCGHHFCWKCLEVKADDPQSSEIITCCPKCPSWMTRTSIQKLIHDDKLRKQQTALYFKLDGEENQCLAKGCSNMAFIKMTFCSDIYCVECIRSYDGDNICVKNGLKCKRNPEKINFLELQKSFEDKTVNPFLFECHGEKCNLCKKEIVVFEIYRCGHRFCEHCIRKAVLPTRDKEPFPLGKCLQERCQEYFKFPWSSITKEKKKSSKGASQKKQQELKQGSINQDSVSPLPDLDEKEVQEHQQNLSAQKRKQICTIDSSKKQKTAVAPLSRFTGLSNVGLSCYRNAILQTLAETPFFHKMLEPYKEKTAWIGLLSIILERIRAQNTGGQEMLEYLHHFHFEFNKKHSEYREFQQEDTLTFLTSLLNGVHEEFKSLEKLKDPGNEFEDPTSLFCGLLKDKYYCKSCKEDEFFDGESFFSLPLPVTESTSYRGKATLGSCLKGFLNTEDIDGIPCTFCGSSEVTKELMIETFPDVLVLQICKLEEASNSTFQRNRSHVAFWETFADLKARTEKGKELKEALKHYRLLSVVEHIGSDRSGHYICYVRRHGDQTWNRCDDSYVKEVKLQDVRKCDAYLLFYEKCSTKL